MKARNIRLRNTKTIAAIRIAGEQRTLAIFPNISTSRHLLLNIKAQYHKTVAAGDCSPGCARLSFFRWFSLIFARMRENKRKSARKINYCIHFRAKARKSAIKSGAHTLFTGQEPPLNTLLTCAYVCIEICITLALDTPVYIFFVNTLTVYGITCVTIALQFQINLHWC